MVEVVARKCAWLRGDSFSSVVYLLNACVFWGNFILWRFLFELPSHFWLTKHFWNHAMLHPHTCLILFHSKCVCVCLFCSCFHVWAFQNAYTYFGRQFCTIISQFLCRYFRPFCVCSTQYIDFDYVCEGRETERERAYFGCYSSNEQ